MKHTNLEYEISKDQLPDFLKRTYQLDETHAKRFANQLFDNIHYIQELLYLEENNIEEDTRYFACIEKKMKKLIY